MKRKPADLTLRETLRWEPQTGFQRIDQHIRRLLRSADALGFRAPANAVQALEKAVGGDKPLCVRLVMNHRGTGHRNHRVRAPATGYGLAGSYRPERQTRFH